MLAPQATVMFAGAVIVGRAAGVTVGGIGCAADQAWRC